MNEQEKSRLLSVSRREVKYLLSFTDRLYVLDALDRLLTPDAYGGYNGYTVRSVYFDSMYDRRAYTHKNFNTRITLDNHLRYCAFHYDLFSHHLNFKKAMHDDLTILEIKYDRFLFKQIQDVLSHCDLTRKPPSKFGTSRELLKLYYH